MSPLARLLASGVLLLTAAAPSAGVTPAARAAGAGGYCPGETGVTVVVDFTDLGGDVVVRCAPGRTGTGTDALAAAGFTFEGTRRWGTAFICRIQGRPAAAEKLPMNGDGDYQEQCVDTPPTEASWSYSHAENGGDWTYSTSSARTHRAIEGGFEGWRFTLNGGGTEPSVEPRRPGADTSDPPEPDQPDQPDRRDKPNKPDRPDKPDRPEGPNRPEQPSDDGPGDPAPTEPTDEPTDEPSEVPSRGPTDAPTAEPTDEPAQEPSIQPSRPHRSDNPDRPRNRPDRPKERPRRPGRSADPRDAELGTTTEGAAVTGELPAQSTADAEAEATSGTTALLGVGLLALLGAGAAFTAYRRRSQQP